jgi:vacuolar protein sorting-associated protein 13A/C
LVCKLHFQVFEFQEQDGSRSASKKHAYILQPVSGKAKYTKIQLTEAKKTGQALQNTAVDLDDVTLSLSKVCTPVFSLSVLSKAL